VRDDRLHSVKLQTHITLHSSTMHSM